MSENLRVIRFYLVLLAIFTVGRWGLSLGGAKYEDTHQVFSIVILTLISSAYYGLLTRGFVGGGLKRALAIGALLGAASQVVIFLSTAISYILGIDSFFNYPRALNVPEAIPFGQAMVARAITFVVNVVFNVIAAALGYAIAGVGPKAGEVPLTPQP
jgi:hypothetical protein